jgi:L-alanine-DL-glutamate epimerase-like enolase superfamily enzyme
VVKFGWEPFGRDRQVDLPRGRAIRRAAGDRVEVMIDTGLA